MLRGCFSIVLLAFHLSSPMPGPSPVAPDASHDLHVSYGDLSLSGGTAVLRMRLFTDDLEAALDKMPGGGSPSPDSAFVVYFSDRFELRGDGLLLTPRLVGGGRDRLGGEPVSWYMFRFDAFEPIRSVRITHRVMLELFDDQRNLLNVVYVPDETRRVLYFNADRQEMEFTVGR